MSLDGAIFFLAIMAFAFLGLFSISHDAMGQWDWTCLYIGVVFVLLIPVLIWTNRR